MIIGASLILKTVQAIETNNYPQTEQSVLIGNEQKIKSAPKIFKEDCFIDWKKSTTEIYNFVRGLSPYPAAFMILLDPDGKKHQLKIFQCKKEITLHNENIGSIHTDSKNYLKIAASDGYISITDLQLSGKKRMTTSEFLRGFPLNANWKTELNNDSK